MVEYVIEKDGYGFSYLPFEDTITMGFNKKHDKIDNLTDDEMLELIADNLTHEHIHRALHKITNTIVCKLFDVIEDKFCNVRLCRKVYGNNSWANAIKERGMSWFYVRYQITPLELRKALIDVNIR